MEGYLFKWLSFIKGWKPRFLVLEGKTLKISKKKDDEKHSIIDLNEAKIIDEKKKKYFLIETTKKKLYLKTENEEQKLSWIKKLNEHKGVTNTKKPFERASSPPKEAVEEEISEKGRFSMAYKQYSEEINKQNLNLPLDGVIKNLLNIQNLIFELTYCVDDFKANINQKNINKDDLFKTHNELWNIKNELKV